ncbi:hypothetical protein FRB94_012592 [Tulasnella sp. JGI-2019a]|nr:hypothetical protein FRB93_001445 [Tulasnella sp. JGI-2019a]KAG9009067.1 hypothetical protein FRB94_012592 [Tulasnella sp. JGI-2019a]
MGKGSHRHIERGAIPNSKVPPLQPLPASAHPGSTTATTVTLYLSGAMQSTGTTPNPTSTETFIKPTVPTTSVDARPTTDLISGASSGLSPTVIAVVGALTAILAFILTVWQGWQAAIYLRQEHRKGMETLEAERRAIELRSVSQHSAVE